MKKVTRLSVLLLAFLLTSCGFHLRGVHQLPAWLTQVYVLPGNHLGLAKHLEKVLQQQKVSVVTQADQAKVLLQLGQTTVRQTDTAVGTLTEYTLSLSTPYTVTDANGISRVTGETIQTGSYELNTDKLLAGTAQKQQLQRRLLEETAQAIVGHMARTP